MRKRFERFRGSKSVLMVGPLLSSGATMTTKALPSLTTVKIKFTKSDMSYHVTHGPDVAGTFFLKIEKATLFIKR